MTADSTPEAAAAGGRRRLTAAVLDDRAWLVEVFVAANLAFLVLDVYVAHSMNEFGHVAEWIPFWFAAAGAAVLIGNLLMSTPLRGDRRFHLGSGYWIGLVVGLGSVAVGVAGMAFHLEGRFFGELTLHSLVYSAPFVAPLAFAGLGLLLVLNRLVPHGSEAWARWVIAFALGGCVGNFLLSLIDHAQNGFFFATEWIAVAAGAIAVGTLVPLLLARVPPAYLRFAFGVLAVQVLVAVAGFVFHLSPLLEPSAAALPERIVFGPPPFAPLLFADLAVLAALGLWELDATRVRPVSRRFPRRPCP